ncbi:NACHT domain-containing protein [Streptacidiphilus sp. PAMC 29251]
MAQEQSFNEPTQAGRTWWAIRPWEGSQHRAFEELCFQLRDEAPPGWQTIKTAAPDGGVEWYDLAPDGTAHGFQVKFVADVDALRPLARESAETVGSNRASRNIVKLTFLVPFDLPDPTPITPKGRTRVGARDRWNTEVTRWKKDLPGLDDMTIEFVGGGELLERLNRPGNEGRRWFFFEQRALGPDWFREQMTASERAAESRYTPLNHVPLPLSRIIDACALPPEYRERLARRSRDLHKAVARVTQEWELLLTALHEQPIVAQARSTIDPLLAQAKVAADTLLRELPGPGPRKGLPASDGYDLVNDIKAVLEKVTARIKDTARLLEASELTQQLPESRAVQLSNRVGGLAEDHGSVDRAIRAAEGLGDELGSDSAQAAESRAWLLLGEAGQGKTHLLVDAARRAVDGNRPALVLFGQELQGHDVLTQLGRHCGLGDMAHRDLLQAMNAVGEASDCRFLLIIDALNDADDPSGWKTELPRLQGLLEAYPHIALVVSCRTTLKDLVLPEHFEGPQSSHPGFKGREMEALESYLRDLPSALPQVPMLAPAFTNPLFVKLYVDSLREAVRQHYGEGSVQVLRDRSAVFDAFVDMRSRQICQKLRLDPADQPVHQALETLAAHMAQDGMSVLSRTQARAVVDAFAPHRTEWPDTMLGQLLAHGLLSNERAFALPGQIAIGFPYQAFGDDRVVHAVLNLHRDELGNLGSSETLAAGSPLRAWLEDAPGNQLEAATVLLPETTGRELADLLTHPSSQDDTDASPEGRRQRAMASSLVTTLPLRSAASVTKRTVALLREAGQAYGLSERLLEAIIAVTAEPGHCLNADHLHGHLIRRTRPDRDASWGRQTYYALTHPTALHRLLRWAEQYPLPAHLRLDESPTPGRTLQPRARTRDNIPPSRPRPADDEVVRLAATTLTWTLTSPNRFLRDRATKALVQLLLGHPKTLLDIAERFLRQDAAKVDDPYLFERLILVGYGVFARTGSAPDELRQFAELLLDRVYGDPGGPVHASRNVLVCHAATRTISLASSTAVITHEQASVAAHPHACPPVGPAPTEDQIKERYPRNPESPRQSWGSILSSLSAFGDFARYQVEPAVGNFSKLPLTALRPRPRRERRSDPPRLSTDGIPAFIASLPADVRTALGTPEAVQALLDQSGTAHQILDNTQLAHLQGCQVQPTEDEVLADSPIDTDWATRWIAARVDDLGWSPDLFGEFDQFRGAPSSARQDHKAERFGKKYQWLALHELVERLANHHHVREIYDDDAPVFQGPDPGLLDIDPTLPPARHLLDEDDEALEERVDQSTFPADPADFRAPATPWLPGPDDELDKWISSKENLPDLSDLAVRTDEAGRRWAVLYEYVRDSWAGQGWDMSEGQAEQWHLIHSWIVAKAQRPALLRFLKTRSLMGRWMPAPREHHGVYLAQIPLLPTLDLDAGDDEWHVRARGSEVEEPQQAHDTPQEPSSTRLPDIPLLQDVYGYSGIETDDSDGGVAAWRERQTAARDARLHRLARQWQAGPTTEERSPWLPSPIAGEGPDMALGPRGKPVSAWPVTQDYTWSSAGRDCSIDSPVHVSMLSGWLLQSANLRQHPSKPLWYDADGVLQVQHHNHGRPTGQGSSLLAAEDWVLAHLDTLDLRLVQGILGERQPVTAESRVWQEFSQSVGLEPDGRMIVQPRIHHVRRSRR